MSDFEQCSTWLQLDLITFLVVILYQFGQIMTRYDFIERRWSTFHVNLGQIMNRCDFLWAR